MAGVTWTAENKVRPRAYTNFTSVARPSITVGSRGIAIVALDLDWGAEDEIIEVYSTDFYGSASLPLIGYNSLNAPDLGLTSMLSGAYLAKVYRKNKGGVKASATNGGLTITAKYAGTAGNSITVVVEDNDGNYTVTTYFNGTSRDSQTIEAIEDLEDNDFASFSGSGTPTVSAGIALTGGTNGTATALDVYGDYLDLALRTPWQIMAVPETDTAIKNTVVTFIKNAIETEGRSVQAVIPNSGTDFDGVINLTKTGKIDGVALSIEEFSMCIAGAEAGAEITESLTGYVIPGMTEIIDPLTNSEIIKALQNGEMVLSQNANGDIQIEQDINSLHTFTQDKNKEFSKNRVWRVLAEINTTIGATWDSNYKGKVSNNEAGRAAFRADLIAYLQTLQDMGAIDEFAGADDVTVEKGTDTDAVVCTIYVMPVDSMEKLYMTVYVTV